MIGNNKIYLALLSAVALCSATSAVAQDWGSALIATRENGRQYRSYMTNAWNDNLYFGVQGGAATRFTAGESSDIRRNFVNPTYGAYFLKWITPVVGARFGYIGGNGREGLSGYNPYQIYHTPLPYKVDGTDTFVEAASGQNGTLHYGSMFLHFDLMFNFINSFCGYENNRFYTGSVYMSGGYMRLFDNKTEGNKGLFSTHYDQEFALSAGVYNTFRISDRFLGTADLRMVNHASRYRAQNTGIRTWVPSLSVGLAYNLYATSWRTAGDVYMVVSAAEEAAKEAEKVLAETQVQKEKLTKEVAELVTELAIAKEETKEQIVKADSVSYEILKIRAARADLVVYFYIDQATLNFTEMHHLNNYAQEMLEDDPDHVFRITGSADKGTGTHRRNTVLSYARAKFVKTYLMKEYGVKEDNIIVSTVITDKHTNGALDRCVIFE